MFFVKGQLGRFPLELPDDSLRWQILTRTFWTIVLAPQGTVCCRWCMSSLILSWGIRREEYSSRTSQTNSASAIEPSPSITEKRNRSQVTFAAHSYSFRRFKSPKSPFYIASSRAPSRPSSGLVGQQKSAVAKILKLKGVGLPSTGVIELGHQARG